MKEFDEIIEKCELIKYLQNYIIELGVLDINKNKYCTATFFDNQNQKFTETIHIEDVLYLTEYGTLTIPGRPILSHLTNWISEQINLKFENIINDIFNFTKESIDTELSLFEKYINNYIENYLTTYPDTVNYHGKIVGNPDTNLYIVDFIQLKRYISCRIYKNFL